MKRIAALLLAIMLLLGSSAFAETDINLDELSLVDLIALRNQIDERIQSMVGSSLPVSGRIVTGVDVKEGYYILANPKTNNGYATIKIYETPESEEPVQEFYINVGEEGSVHLIGSNVLSIKGSLVMTWVADPVWKP